MRLLSLLMVLGIASTAHATVVAVTDPSTVPNSATILDFSQFQVFNRVTVDGDASVDLVGHNQGMGVASALNIFNPRNFGPADSHFLQSLASVELNKDLGLPDVRITFAHAVGFVGADFYNNANSITVFSLFSGQTLVGQITNNRPASNAFTLFGFASDTAFDSVLIQSTRLNLLGSFDRSPIEFDNLAFADPAAGRKLVPEPASSVLLLSVGAIGLTRRRASLAT